MFSLECEIAAFVTTPFVDVWVVCLQGILVREVDDARPCLSCRDGCPTGYKQHPWR